MLDNHSKLLLLGFGDINQRLAQIKKTASIVVAVRRSEMFMEGIDCRVGDVTDQLYLKSLLKDEKPDQIVVTLSPSEYSEQGYKKTYLAAAEALVNAARQTELTPEAVVFISSSSVYAQDSGEHVDEQSPCSPSRYNGQVLLQAEQCLLESQLPATIIRFSGIYGPGRYRLLKSSLTNNPISPEVIHWTNRIHATDCARVIAHILSLSASERAPVYLASDHHPVPSHVVKRWIAQQLNGKSSTDEVVYSQEGVKATGKRCDNSLLTKSGFQFKYPSYRDGFPNIIADYLKETS